jgi:DNA repair protein RadC
VHPREVFRGAIVASCANIIIAHNHPGTYPEPSNEDFAITKKLAEAGKLIDFALFDPIIFAEDKFSSQV